MYVRVALDTEKKYTKTGADLETSLYLSLVLEW